MVLSNRWQTKYSGMRSLKVRAISTSQKWGTMCIAMHCIAWTRRNQTFWGSYTRNEGRMWERGAKHVIIHWWKWPEQMDGTLKVFLYGMKSSGFGTCPLNSDSSAISRRARTAVFGFFLIFILPTCFSWQNVMCNLVLHKCVTILLDQQLILFLFLFVIHFLDQGRTL